MKRLIRSFALVVATFTPVIASAGIMQQRQVPTLGEAGLVILGLGLLGSGVAVLRRKR